MNQTIQYRTAEQVSSDNIGMFFCTFSSKKYVLASEDNDVLKAVLNDSARCSFTGKEKDSETGYYYFGARYYNPDLSLWLSVDPMSDKYPSLSPYNYCAWNPMKLVDPDGKYFDEPPSNLIYSVKQGDNFWNLEKSWGIPHGTLESLNANIDPNELQIGQRINVARMEGDILVVGNNTQIPAERSLTLPHEDGMVGFEILSSSDNYTQFRMAFEALMPSMGGFLQGPGGRIVKNASNVDKILQRASYGKGNFGIGRGSYAEAMEAGKAWVGKGYRVSSRDQSILISADGKRQFRAPTYKKGVNKIQANFQSRKDNFGRWTNNGHMDVDRW